MYGRSERGYMRRGRGGGSGYDYGRDSYPEPWMSPYDRPNRGSYRPKRGRYDYSEPERGGYRGRRKQHRPPHHASPRGRGDLRGGFRGNFRPSRPVRGARTPNHPPFPQRDQFQQLKPFVDNFYFGGGFKLKERRRWKREWNSKYEKEQSPAKRMKRSAENNDNDEEPAQSTRNEEDREAGTQEETEQTQSSREKHQETQKEFLNNNLWNRIQFFCTLCKFRTFYEDEWNNHQQSDFHKEHFQKMYERVPKAIAGFFEAYVENSYKKVKYHRQQVEDLNAKILQVYQRKDLTRGLHMDHFMKKVEITHCAACDIFLPMRLFSLKKHIKSASHKSNCTLMMNISQEAAVKTSMSILENKSNKHILELYKNGKNPFIYSDENLRSGCSGDFTPEGEESGETPCITLSDSEGEDDDFQGQNSFIKEEEEDIRSDCSTEVVPETEESEQMPCSTPPDTERDEEEDYCDGQVAEQEPTCESL